MILTKRPVRIERSKLCEYTPKTSRNCGFGRNCISNETSGDCVAKVTIVSLGKLIKSKLLERNDYLKYQETRATSRYYYRWYLNISKCLAVAWAGYSHNKKEDFLNETPLKSHYETSTVSLHTNASRYSWTRNLSPASRWRFLSLAHSLSFSSSFG